MSEIEEIHAPELADGLADVAAPEWEPATFELRCPAAHWWDSRGTFHAASYTMAPNQPTCPRRACGQLAELTIAYLGPHRPGAVEAWRQ